MVTNALKIPLHLYKPGGQTMANQEAAKTRTIGYLPIEKVRNLAGWDEYLDKSTKLSMLRAETQKAKNSVRDDLKQRLSEKGDIDFVAEGDRIRIFQVFRKQPQVRRTRTPDLSSSFCEQPIIDTETNGGLRGAEQGIPGQGVPEDCGPTLDPITERLTTLMKHKMGR
jgi:hypothetical protein